MKLLIIWAIISITIGFFFKFIDNQYQYILLSFIMLSITYIYNNINPTKMSIKNAIILSIIPNTCFWYLAYHCNNFLWVYPYEWFWFTATFFIYSYILIYIACEC